MQSVKKFNALNGAVVSREEIERMLTLAHSEEQYNLSDRLEYLLINNPDVTNFKLDIVFPAVNQVPGSVLNGIQFDDEKEIQGLGKAVTSNDIYDNITNLMINTIKQVGYLPWQKEWTGSGVIGARNFVTGKPYSGINFYTLNYTVKYDDKGLPYLVVATQEPQYFLTFNQIQDYGAKIKKGSKAREVIYYNFILNYKDQNVSFSSSAANKFSAFAKQNKLTEAQIQQNLKRIPILKYYNVFNSNDCEGLPAPKKIEKAINVNDYAQFIIDNYPNKPDYRFGSDKAFYSPSGDYVSMPLIGAFTKESSYYSTYFHEITHSTGHISRLSRDMSGKFGNEKYAFEELIAELGATYLCSETGILFETIDNSAKYLKSWSKKLISAMEEDNKFFLKAAAAAQRAANYILDSENSNRKVFKDITKSTQAKVKPSSKKVDLIKPKATVLPGSTVKKVTNQKKTDIIKPKATVLAKEKNNQDPTVKVDKKTRQIALFKPNKTTKKPKALNGLDDNVILEEPKTNKNIEALKKLGFVSADSAPNEAIGIYTLPGQIGQFLQEQQPHKSLILIKGNKHSSKSQLAMQIANAYAEQGELVAYIDYEQGGIDCKDTVDSIKRNTTEKGRKNIVIKGYLENPFEELQNFCKVCKTIVADSVTDLKITADQLNELRNKFINVTWVFISQVKENGAMYGGNKMAHNPTVVINCSSNTDPSKRIATLEKNRGNDLSLSYNMFDKKVVFPEKTEVKPIIETKQFSSNHSFIFEAS